MNLGWKEWSRIDIIYGVIAPIVVVLLIVGVSQLDRLIGGGFNVVTGIVMQLEELLVIVVIPSKS